MVEQWSPKPKVKGSNPFSLDYPVRYEEVADIVHASRKTNIVLDMRHVAGKVGEIYKDQLLLPGPTEHAAQPILIPKKQIGVRGAIPNPVGLRPRFPNGVSA